MRNTPAIVCTTLAGDATGCATLHRVSDTLTECDDDIEAPNTSDTSPVTPANMAYVRQSRLESANMAHIRQSRPESANVAYIRQSRPESTNMAHVRQSRPDSGLVFQVKVIKPCQVVPFSLGR